MYSFSVQFERSSRGKSGSLCGLEEVLSCIQRIEFDDEQLSKYRGMCWTEFVAHVEKRNNGQGTSSSSSSNSSLASSPEPAPRPASPPPVISSPRQRLRGALVRAQSERCFERRLTGARSMWRGLDRTLPMKPSPLVTTLSEKDLLVSPGSTTSRAESKRREAVWDLFQSECAFLYDHLMVLKNVFMEPLKKIQVEGFAMFAEPELLFGNLDELCCVTYAFCKEFITLLLENVGAGGELPTIDVLSTEADSVSQAYHCYALNYINALNYLETLRRHVEFCEFEKVSSDSHIVTKLH
ncbi:hypothetical protein C0J52_07507 [Blattella germanica]|nr:hypothetical protein C0J52_07507 [Blattella germanica]